MGGLRVNGVPKNLISGDNYFCKGQKKCFLKIYSISCIYDFFMEPICKIKDVAEGTFEEGVSQT